MSVIGLVFIFLLFVSGTCKQLEIGHYHFLSHFIGNNYISCYFRVNISMVINSGCMVFVVICFITIEINIMYLHHAT